MSRFFGELPAASFRKKFEDKNKGCKNGHEAYAALNAQQLKAVFG